MGAIFLGDAPQNKINSGEEPKGKHPKGSGDAQEPKPVKRKQIWQSAAQKRCKGPAQEGALNVGIMLVKDPDAKRKASLLHFENRFTDACEFMTKVLKVSPAKRQGHVVVAPSPANTDWAIGATLAAGLLGCFLTTPEKFVHVDETRRGIKYTETFKAKRGFFLAASDGVRKDLPTLVSVLKQIACAPDSCVTYAPEQTVCETFRKEIKSATSHHKKTMIEQRFCVLSHRSERNRLDERTNDKSQNEHNAEVKKLYITPQTLIDRFHSEACNSFPGEQ